MVCRSEVCIQTEGHADGSVHKHLRRTRCAKMLKQESTSKVCKCQIGTQRCSRRCSLCLKCSSVVLQRTQQVQAQMCTNETELRRDTLFCPNICFSVSIRRQRLSPMGFYCPKRGLVLYLKTQDKDEASYVMCKWVLLVESAMLSWYCLFKGRSP